MVNGVEKITHLAPFVDDVVPEKEPARLEPRHDQIEKPLVVLLPGVQKHEVDRAGDLRDLLKGVARNDRHDIGQAGAANVLGGAAGARRVELDGRETAAGLPEPKPNPDRTVSVSRADLERTRRAPRYDHRPQKAAILLRHGHLVLVGRLDLL